MRKKIYKLYLNISEPKPENLYSFNANFVGRAIGDIEVGAQVISNLTAGAGNNIGPIAPSKTGVFSMYENVLIKPTGERLTLQHPTGPHDLSFLQAFIQFVIQSPVTKISGDTYEGLDGHKGYVLTFTAEGKSQKATVTNFWGWVKHAAESAGASALTGAVKSAVNDAATSAGIPVEFDVGIDMGLEYAAA